jgi:hypothetical protein
MGYDPQRGNAMTVLRRAAVVRKRRRRNIFREAMFDELVATGMTREAVEAALRMNLFIITREFRREFKCGAHARLTGKPCQAHALENGRCRNHGGLSTGSRTREGRARQAEATRKRWAAYRKAKMKGFTSPCLRGTGRR